MSRTYKDIKKVKLIRYYKERWETEYYRDIPELQFYWLKKPGVTPKKRKEVDTEDHWLSYTPSWWNNMFHTRPTRRKFANFCITVKKYRIHDLDIFLEPSESRKPHKYYY